MKSRRTINAALFRERRFLFPSGNDLQYRKYFHMLFINLVSALADLVSYDFFSLWFSGSFIGNVRELAEKFPTFIYQSKSTRQHSKSFHVECFFGLETVLQFTDRQVIKQPRAREIFRPAPRTRFGLFLYYC